MSSLGKKLEELRKNAGITQDELACKLHVSRQSVSNWELDLVTPKSDMLKALCEIFNVKPEYLLFENAEKQPLVSAEEEIAVTLAEETEPKKKSCKQIAITVSIFILSVLVAVCAVISFSWYFIISSCISDVSVDVGLYANIDFENTSTLNDFNVTLKS